MKIFMTGGTGFIGTSLVKALTQKGHKVTVLTRKIKGTGVLPQGAVYFEGDPTEAGPWQEKAARDHHVIINLAGASIFRRWTKKAKQEIRESRIRTTQNLVEALSLYRQEKTLLMNTSAVGFYGYCGDTDLDEGSPPGNDFLASLVLDWESAAMQAAALGVRVLLLRFGIVLGHDGGALEKMISPFKWYLGSPLGSGEQWFSWIHEKDLTSIYLFLLDQKDISGPINCTAPHPVRNREMTKILGRAIGKPTLMPAVPAMMINLILGEFGAVLLKGQKVLPGRLLNFGFQFQFPSMMSALQDLLSS
jgi:uncharacterized protein